MKREDILAGLLDYRVNGLWSDTLFPGIKDMIGYGADYFSQDKSDGVVDAALDMALVTLSTMAPELIPVLKVMKDSIADPSKNKLSSLISQIKNWSIQGFQKNIESQEH